MTGARARSGRSAPSPPPRSEEHTSELQSQSNLVCRLLLEKKQSRRRPARAASHSDSRTAARSRRRCTHPFPPEENRPRNPSCTYLEQVRPGPPSCGGKQSPSDERRHGFWNYPVNDRRTFSGSFFFLRKRLPHVSPLFPVAALSR